MAESKLSPLQYNVALVNPDGTPTPYFIQLLQQLYEEKDITDALAAGAVPGTRLVNAGAGLTGGGALSADITLSASVQAILNLVSTTRGAVLYRGAAVWSALLPGTAGYYLQTAGAGADPLWAAVAAGAAGRFLANLGAMPALAGFGTLNTNADRTIVETAGKAFTVIAKNAVAAVQAHGVTLAVPVVTPYRVAVFVQSNNIAALQYHGPAFGWTNGVALKLVYDQAGGAEYAPWTNGSTRGAVTALSNGPLPHGTGGYWIGLRDDGVNFIWEVSSDGGTFHPIQSQARDATYNKIFVGHFSYKNVTFADQGSTTILCYDPAGLTRGVN